MDEDKDQEAIDKACREAAATANFRVTLEFFFQTDGIRPAEIPLDIDQKLAMLIVKRTPPMISAASLEYPGRWRLILRVVGAHTDERPEA